MDDVFRHGVLAPSDKNLCSRNTVVVTFWNGARAHSRQIRSCLWFGQVHGSRPFPRYQIGQIHRLLFRRAVAFDCMHRTRRQHRTQRKRHTGRMPHLRGQRRNDLGQSLSSPLRIIGKRAPPRLAELPIGLRKTGCRCHHVVFEHRAVLIARPVQRVEHPSGKLTCLLDHRIDEIRRCLLAARQTRYSFQPDQLLDNELHVIDRCQVCRHSSSPVTNRLCCLKRVS